MDAAEKVRTAERLLALRHKLRSEVSERAGRNSLLIASWNLRDFDNNRLGHGHRLRESYYYIAEIVSAFDLVVLQEVSRNLDALEALLSILGPEWDYLATDSVDNGSGAEERMAFLYRQSKVMFRKIAGEVVLPGGQTVAGRSNAELRRTGELAFNRAPFLAAFQAGGFNFNLATLHLRYDGLKAQEVERHGAQCEALARFFRDRQDRDREDYFLLGDFGVGAPSDLMARVLERAGFAVPEALTKKRAHLDARHYYDQIAFRSTEDRLELAGSGAFRPFDTVFRDIEEDFAAYRDQMPEEKADDLWNGGPRGYYSDHWRSWQMSDHVLLWVGLKVDFSDHYLSAISKTASQG
ncbi:MULTISPECIES: endonuclease/exonuclease/phosphatase family protein [Rhodomicrobium]|uniref:endonuclease/exonuclease/phosphatase family protein n=1 Tax=Rhodomicrobium TaxID=1068 RepID=UPI000B4AD279|nr:MULTISPECIES: endonuclease/exonuclease/phosphatase family protein [Rhodomicrobium]